jgi:hypothetical protein
VFEENTIYKKRRGIEASEGVDYSCGARKSFTISNVLKDLPSGRQLTFPPPVSWLNIHVYLLAARSRKEHPHHHFVEWAEMLRYIY